LVLVGAAHPGVAGPLTGEGRLLARSVRCPGANRYTLRHTREMTELKIGCARVSTLDQDLTAQRDALTALGVDPDRIYVDHGLTGTNRDRPGLRQALAACRRGDTLVVTTLDRLARSVPDARDITDELTAAGVKLNIGGSVHDPTDPLGRLLFTTLTMIAEFSVIWTRRSSGFLPGAMAAA